jgi:glutamate-5-semialdehyde dehydrogenase
MKPVEVARKAKEASSALAHLPTDRKNGVLQSLARLLEENKPFLFEENLKDLTQAREEGMAESLVERLRLDEKVLKEMILALHDVMELPDPVGDMGKLWRRPNGLLVGRMRIPIGVICIIYESRPNVTVDAFSLCLKSGNAVILKGGREAYYSNRALFSMIAKALEQNKVTPHAASLVETSEREYLYDLLKLTDEIDLVIPRGGEALIGSVAEHSRVPVLKHYKGVCAIYVDEHADLEMAQSVCLNAKVQKPATCNAVETLLVHEGISREFLPSLMPLFSRNGVTVRGCKRVREMFPEAQEALERDWYEEYLDLTIAVRIVDDMDEAIAHIGRYGSEHTDAIITSDYANAWRFLREVDSSLVLVNASTRLNDGYQLGLGTEMGISTTKLHAFGPMGLEELTVRKFIAFGDGQVRV